MSKLFIRDRSCGYITFLKGKQELQAFIVDYLPGRHLVIGDLSNFTNAMIQILLKFIEENPSVDCYSSTDPCNSILQSRFVSIVKQPLTLTYDQGDEKFLSSDRSYQSAEIHLSKSCAVKLRAPLLRGKALNLLLNGTGN